MYESRGTSMASIPFPAHRNNIRYVTTEADCGGGSYEEVMKKKKGGKRY